MRHHSRHLRRALVRGRAIQQARLSLTLSTGRGTGATRLKQLLLAIKPPRRDTSLLGQFTLLNGLFPRFDGLVGVAARLVQVLFEGLTRGEDVVWVSCVLATGGDNIARFAFGIGRVDCY
jgi:hypothetical protein